jgi:DNA-binding response OmpR family regulator
MRPIDVIPRLRSHVANLRSKLDRGTRISVISRDVGTGYRFVGNQHAAVDSSSAGDR